MNSGWFLATGAYCTEHVHQVEERQEKGSHGGKE